MPERIRFGASFQTDDCEQMRAWQILSAYPPRQRTAALARMICGYQDQMELLDAIRQLLKEELQSVALKEPPQEKAEDVDDDVLGFIVSLQKGEVFH